MCLTNPGISTIKLQSSDIVSRRRRNSPRAPTMALVPPSKLTTVVSDSERDDEARPDFPTSDKVLYTHEYHDHAYERDDDDCDSANGGNHKRRGPRGGVAHPFPEILHIMLENVEEEGLSHIVSWHPHGRSFAVHKPKEFVTEIMPRYFKQTKLTSFQRQLNLYGFSRLTVGPDRGGYYHELFLRHRLFLCDRMMRTRIKGTGTKAAMNPESEPDFYAIPPVKPLDETPRKPPNKTTWKMTYESTPLKKKQDKKPTLQVKHRRVSVCENDYEPFVVQSSESVCDSDYEPLVVQSCESDCESDYEPLVVQSNELSESPMVESYEPPMVQSSEPVLPMPRPPSYPAILPLIMPVLPKSSMELDQTAPTITPPSTPMQEDELPTTETPDEWMLSDGDPLDQALVFEGKTFHFLDACSFDCLHEDQGYDQASCGLSLKDSDAFFAGM